MAHSSLCEESLACTANTSTSLLLHYSQTTKSVVGVILAAKLAIYTLSTPLHRRGKSMSVLAASHFLLSVHLPLAMQSLLSIPPHASPQSPTLLVLQSSLVLHSSFVRLMWFSSSCLLLAPRSFVARFSNGELD